MKKVELRIGGYRAVTGMGGTALRLESIVMTVYGARWVLEIPRGTLCKVYGCLKLCLTSETNIK